MKKLSFKKPASIKLDRKNVTCLAFGAAVLVGAAVAAYFITRSHRRRAEEEAYLLEIEEIDDRENFVK